jgi:prepilin-type N-terminal cleavage/methylation domain-containing protein
LSRADCSRLHPPRQRKPNLLCAILMFENGIGAAQLACTCRKVTQMNAPRLGREGFTLVELMIVVATIGLLATIAIPNFVRARTQSQTSACINNLRQIDDASQEWALENQKAATAPVNYTDISPYLKHGATCPAAGGSPTFGGSYTLKTVADKPVCKIWPPTHLLPPDGTGGPPHVRPIP